VSADDEDGVPEDYYCRDCGKGGLLCMCHPDDDPREYEAEADPRKYDQGGEG
jgi:hypothetical protein